MADDLSAVTDAELVLIDGVDLGEDGYTEGPVWHPEQYLLFVRHRLGYLYRWDPKTKTSKVIRENTGRMTGCVLDYQGRLICCEGDNSRVTRIDPGPEASAPAEDWPKPAVVIADSWKGKSLNKPNDVVIRSDGTVYFTDPVAKGRQNATEIEAVYLITPDGELQLATDECEYENGLTLSPDESTLYVAVTTHHLIRAFDVAKDGSLSNNRVFATLESDFPEKPDGMKVDSDGRLYCASGGGVWVFRPDGYPLGVIPTSGQPRNLCFGGPDMSTMFICAGENMYSLETHVTGIPTYAG